jgi:hypothetical protein
VVHGLSSHLTEAVISPRRLSSSRLGQPEDRHLLGKRVAGVILGWSLAALEPAGAEAQEIHAIQLTYSGLRGCASESAFRMRVAAQLGQDPFVQESDEHLRIVLVIDASRSYRAILEREGSEVGVRSMGPSRSCSDLVQAMAVTAALWLDPFAVSRSADPNWASWVTLSSVPHEAAEIASPPPQGLADQGRGDSPVSSAPDLDLEQPPQPTRESSASLDVHLGAEIRADFGLAPEVVPGGSVWVAVELGGWLQLDVGGRVRHTARIVPTSVPGESATYGGFVAPCGVRGNVELCVITELGAHVVSSDTHEVAWHAAAGAALAYEWRVSREAGVRIAVEAQANLAPVRWVSEGRVLFAPPPVFGGLSIGWIGTW